MVNFIPCNDHNSIAQKESGTAVFHRKCAELQTLNVATKDFNHVIFSRCQRLSGGGEKIKKRVKF